MMRPDTGEFDNAVISPTLVKRLEKCIGCVQCGRTSNEQYLGYACCGAKQCRQQIQWIQRSHRVSETLKRRKH